MLNYKAKIIIFVSLLCILGQAQAKPGFSLYDVEALVADESAATRQRAFKEGLDEVFVRIAGDSIVMNKLKRPSASRYVKQYSYDPVEEPETNKAGKLLSHSLKIQYNGSAMEKYLRDNGFPVWGERRSDVVVWLAIRDGKNEYVLKQADRSLIKATADKALHRRGIPGHWPLYDKKDRKIVDVADIRGGFREPVTKASTRYSRGPALTGSLIWNGKKWHSSWNLLMKSGNQHWRLEGAGYKGLINKAIDRAADAMGNVFAIHGVGKDQALVAVQLDIQAVDSINKYRKLENYLRALSAVESVIPLKVDGQNAAFEVTLRSSEQDFINLVENDATLVEVRPVKPYISQPPQAMGAADRKHGANRTADTMASNAKNTVTGSVWSKTSDKQPASQPGSQADSQAGSQPGLQPQPAVVQPNMQPVQLSPQLPVYYYKYSN